MFLGPHRAQWIPGGPPLVYIFGWQNGGHFLVREEILTILGTERGLVDLGGWQGLLKIHITWILGEKSCECSDFEEVLLLTSSEHFWQFYFRVRVEQTSEEKSVNSCKFLVKNLVRHSKIVLV